MVTIHPNGWTNNKQVLQRHHTILQRHPDKPVKMKGQMQTKSKQEVQKMEDLVGVPESESLLIAITQQTTDSFSRDVRPKKGVM